MTEWISVKDRLPDQYTRLAYVYGPDLGVTPTSEEGHYIFWSEERKRWGEENRMGFIYDSPKNITHWMERPKPPEGL